MDVGHENEAEFVVLRRYGFIFFLRAGEGEEDYGGKEENVESQ